MERNEKDITLILDRSNNTLWIDTHGHKAAIDNVTGVKRAGQYQKIPMWNIMRSGKKVGNVWDVKEIKESIKLINI